MRIVSAAGIRHRPTGAAGDSTGGGRFVWPKHAPAGSGQHPPVVCGPRQPTGDLDYHPSVTPPPSLRRLRRVILGIAAAALVAASAPAQAARLVIACGGIGTESEQCRIAADAWARRTGHQVDYFALPRPADERLALIRQLFAAGSNAIDVIAVDVVWPGMLASHLLALTSRIDGIDRHLPAMRDAATVDGRLLAVPWFTDGGVLFYRRDLLERHRRPVPRTWQELTETAALIQRAERAAGHSPFWGYVWQARAYEGLTCNALELITSHGARLFDADGRIAFDSAPARDALTQAASWVGTISPPGVLNYAEEDSRGVFQSGHAVFMRNWPYAWSLAQGEGSPVRGKVGIAPLPHGPGGGSAAALGGRMLAVAAHTREPEAAIDLVRALTAPQEIRRRAIEAGFAPSLPALYGDADVLAANPHFGPLAEVFRQSVARPSALAGERYGQVSAALFTGFHAILAGRIDATRGTAALRATLCRPANPLLAACGAER